MGSYFRVRTPEVTAEDFKSEVLIIDLKTGHYHSLRGVAAQIWRLLDGGESLPSCIGRLAKLFDVSRGTLEQDTTEFVGELEKLGLISPVPAREASGLELEEGGAAYAKPTVDSYGDLQDLLLLDPIHEIAPEAGWPHRLENA